MHKNTFLAVAIAAMTTVLMAGRCSDDDAATKAKATDKGAAGAAGGAGHVDGGVEKDPLGETMGGGGGTGTVDDDQDTGGTDVSLDEPAPGEPQPVPEAGP